MKKFFVSILCMLMVSSCSSLEFNTNGQEPFYVSSRSGSERIVEVTKSKDFYLWGLLPGTQDFNLQDETKDLGLYNPSFITLEQRFSWTNAFFAVITLGVYVPVDYKVTLLSKGVSK